MAYFNPRPLEFNPNTKTIEAAGALGDALYTQFKDNMERKAKQAELDETARKNKATELQKAYELAQKDNHFGLEMEHKNRVFGETQRHNRNSERINGMNAETSRARLGFNQHKWQSEQQKARQIADAENFGYFKYGVDNGAFKDSGVDLGTLTPEQQLRLGENYKNQITAQNAVNKAVSEANKNDFTSNYNESFNLATTNPEIFGLNEQDMAEFELIKQHGTPEQKLQAGKMLFEKTQARKAINENLGIKPQTASEKSAIAQNQKNMKDTLNVLAGLDNLLYTSSNIGGIDSNSGIADGTIYRLFPGWSSEAGAYKGALNNYAKTEQQTSKGQGSFNYKETIDSLTPNFWGGNEDAIKTIYDRRNQNIQEGINLAKVMQEQGQKGADELLAKFENMFIPFDDFVKMIDGKMPLDKTKLFYQTDNANSQQNSVSLKQKFNQKHSKNQNANNDFYETMDEYGGVYR